jgi:hypothetical protein
VREEGWKAFCQPHTHIGKNLLKLKGGHKDGGFIKDKILDEKFKKNCHKNLRTHL